MGSSGRQSIGVYGELLVKCFDLAETMSNDIHLRDVSEHNMHAEVLVSGCN